MSRYTDAAHRVQTAIAFLDNADPRYTSTQPKHLRVGIDLSKSDMGGLASLLIAKGVFTVEEYVEAITNAAEKEADAYEKQVQAVLGDTRVKTV